MGRHDAVNNRQGGSHRQRDLYQRLFGFLNNTKENRSQKYDTYLQENRNTADIGNNHHRPSGTAFADNIDQRPRQLFSAPGNFHHLADDSAQSQDRRQETQGTAHPDFNGLANFIERHARSKSNEKTSCQQRDKGMNAEFDA